MSKTQTQTDPDERSTDHDPAEPRGDRIDNENPPVGRPFTPEDQKDAARAAWAKRREAVLREMGLWDVWGKVPPKAERTRPLRDYLPEGHDD